MGLRSFRQANKDHLCKQIKIKSRSFRQVDNDHIKKVKPSKLSIQNWNQIRIPF